MPMSIYNPIDIQLSTPDARSLIMPHQQEAVDAMAAYFQLSKEQEDRSGVVVMPTGSGKTYTAVTWLLTQGVSQGYRVVWLVHRQELVNQAFNEFVKQAPLLKGSDKKKLRVLAVSGAHLPMASANRADVYVCSIASVANRYGYRFIGQMLGSAGKRKLIVVVDEAHHVVAANYQRVLKRMRLLNPRMVLLGLTATPIRMHHLEQQRLIRQFHIDENLRLGVGSRGFVYEVTLTRLLMSGFLANPVYEPVQTNIVGEVSYQVEPSDEDYFRRFGELSERLMRQIAQSSARNGLILEQYLSHQARYGKTLIFAVNQLHAETLCEAFKQAGVSCDYAVSSRPDAQQVIQRFKDGEFPVLINVQMMTEGSDVPDIQTVFLTRQTNSEALLMQMIGRGLRGLRAGGTAEAYIVAFHDTWQSFANWLDPSQLDVFQVEDEEELEEPTELPEVISADASNECKERKGLLRGQSGIPTEAMREIYFNLYQRMRASLRADTGAFSFPVGWYSLMDAQGEERSLLVFQDQLSTYASIQRSLPSLKGQAASADYLASCFPDTDAIPTMHMLQLLAENIQQTGEMPSYFSFEQRDLLDPRAIGLDMQERYEEEAQQLDYLKSVYDQRPILQQLYKHFFAFKRTVLDALKEWKDEEIFRLDEREQYEIVEGQHSLEELLAEVLGMFPGLSAQRLTAIHWSKRVVKSWFALCKKDPTGQYYQILVNRLLSSPRIEREVIKYLIFHELLHVNGHWQHSERFRGMEWQYPDAARLDGILDTLYLDYHMENLIISTSETPLPDSIGAEAEATAGSAQVSVSPVRTDAPGILSGYKYCRNCANRLPESAKFCDKCGSNVQYS